MDMTPKTLPAGLPLSKLDDAYAVGQRLQDAKDTKRRLLENTKPGCTIAATIKVISFEHEFDVDRDTILAMLDTQIGAALHDLIELGVNPYEKAE